MVVRNIVTSSVCLTTQNEDVGHDDDGNDDVELYNSFVSGWM